MKHWFVTVTYVDKNNYEFMKIVKVDIDDSIKYPHYPLQEATWRMLEELRSRDTLRSISWKEK